jgi:hypothetical protein
MKIKNKLLNKIANGIAVTIVVVAGFWYGTYYTMNKTSQEILKWSSQYQQINNDLSQFVEVSDPETVRSYIKELNKILDNVKFLNSLIESGQFADKSLSAYENKVDGVNNKLLLLKTELLLLKTESQNNLDSLKLNLRIKINDLEKGIVTSKKDISSLYLKLKYSKINLEEISEDIDKIKNSKYSKKIWLDN